MTHSSLDASRLEADVLDELEAFLREARGPRALSALRPDASLERDLGLGSLERVELLNRLETRLHRKAPDRTLGDAETPGELARAFLAAPEGEVDERERVAAAPPAAARRRKRALDATTLTDALRRWAEAEPLLPHIFLKEDDRPEETITYSDLYGEALRVASGLAGRGIRRGDTVAIMLPTSRGFFTTFMGVLFAGGVPVPLYPPFRRTRIQEYARRQAAILDNAGARIFVTLREGRAVGALLQSLAPSLSGVVEVAELLDSPPLAGMGPGGAAPADPALIQYTSGSTGDPKGVLLSHENLLANIRAIGEAVCIGPADVGVSWLPLYHDMGLIGAWLTPLVHGIPVAIFSPLAFLARPEKWLWTIHRRRGTLSPAPNFAYELAARKIADTNVEGLDLSSWRVALNGAEPVSPRTLERFQKKFEKRGFRSASAFPVYGLAEASLLLAAPGPEKRVRVEAFDRDALERWGSARPPAGASRASGKSVEPVRLVSVGRAIPGHEIRIVDERGEELPERREGRIQFRGPSVMQGYYRNERATAAVLAGDGFLDSGDRGFFAEGELFVTGRDKDLIIQAGRNLIPQELESVASEIPGVRAGSVVAFGVADPSLGTERIVIVLETKEEGDESRSRIAGEVESRVAELVGVAPDDVAVVPPRTIPKTSSGKNRRRACRESYLRGELGRRAKTPLALSARLSLLFALALARRALRSSGRLLYGIYVGALTVAFVAPAWLLVLLGLPRGALAKLVRRESRLYLALAGIHFEVKGREVLQGRSGPFVFVGNHASYLDALPVMAALDCDYAFVVKREAASWPVVGRFIRRLEHVPVERSDANESVAATEFWKAALARGRSLVLFPEGTFTRADGIRPFKLGAFRLASETGVPVVPLALVGTRRLLRDGTLVPRRVPVRIEIGEPIVPSPATDGGTFSSALRLMEQAADAIARRVGEPRLDLPSAALEYS